jgi:predicted HicB family RNase H-like nuclease
MSMTMEIDGSRAVIKYALEFAVLRGVLLDLNDGTHFYAKTIEEAPDISVRMAVNPSWGCVRG